MQANSVAKESKNFVENAKDHIDVKGCGIKLKIATVTIVFNGVVSGRNADFNTAILLIVL